MEKGFLTVIHDGNTIIKFEGTSNFDSKSRHTLKSFLSIRDFDNCWMLFVNTDTEYLVKDFLKKVDFTKTAHICGLGYYNRGQNIKSFGYVEDSPFINTDSTNKYPTWVLNGDLVAIHSSLINKLPLDFFQKRTFRYNVLSLSKLLRGQGITCTQLPVLEDFKNRLKDISTESLYAFVSQHYKKRWIFLLLINHIIYDHRVPLYAFAKALFLKLRKCDVDVFSLQNVHNINEQSMLEYDVIIPTMGRSTYLENVLDDLNNQTITANKIIIYEQNPKTNSISDLDFLQQKDYKFNIEHIFTHQTGACNARNKAISLSVAEWVLLFDDDVRIDTDFSSEVAKFLDNTTFKCVTFACLQQGEKETMKAYKQWESFGSGCSIVHRDVLEKCSFDMALEHGYGEDVDYGMQVRRAGYDVIYAPQIQISHLKAPMGGFREKHLFPWQDERIKPKPSPQIMYHRTKNYTTEQLKGYKLVLFFKTFGTSKTKNPFTHFKRFQEAWNVSKKRASQL